ncbi:MAG: histidine phosphatase family protein [Bifidobacteriaceae bacterium]|jgi:phosphohistidine phosphatase|nr:histidine phosphatase family protein [Bifidobacteriaceae bacterium]
MTSAHRAHNADPTSEEIPSPLLVLLRHARASTSEWSDAARHLSGEGRIQAEVTGRRLTRDGIVPDAVLCSSSARTRETWEAIAAQVGGAPKVRFTEDLYRGYIPELIEAVRGVNRNAMCVMVVGHNPTVSAAAAALAAADSDPDATLRVHRGLSTSAYALLRPLVPWAQTMPGTAILTTVVKPRV